MCMANYETFCPLLVTLGWSLEPEEDSDKSPCARTWVPQGVLAPTHRGPTIKDGSLVESDAFVM